MSHECRAWFPNDIQLSLIVFIDYSTEMKRPVLWSYIETILLSGTESWTISKSEKLIGACRIVEE